MLIDTHAHLDFPDFDRDRDAVVARARRAMVGRILVPGVDLATSRAALALAGKYPGIVYAAAGIHPNETAKARPGDFEALEALAADPGIAAVGEIGLDFYRNRAPRDVQAQWFVRQLTLARDLGKPVILHFRNVEDEGVDVAGADLLGGVRGVFHCFGGSAAFAKRVVEMGFHIGFDGPLTYPRSDRVAVAREVPLERILIETDAPYLTPQPHRGKRNEPSYVRFVAETLAEIKRVGVDEVADITTANARALFGIG